MYKYFEAYCFGLCFSIILVAISAISSSQPVKISWSPSRSELQIDYKKTWLLIFNLGCHKGQNRVCIHDMCVCILIKGMKQNLNCQVASKERMACRRLLLELMAILSANFVGNSIFSFLAMNSKTSIIWKNEQSRWIWQFFPTRVCTPIKSFKRIHSNNNIFLFCLNYFFTGMHVYTQTST